MKNIKTIYSKISVAALLAAAFMFPALSASASAYFNTASNDYATFQVINYTKNSTCTTCWSTSVSADAGDIVSFFVLYHNTSGETANNVNIKTILPTGSFTSQSAMVSIWADNAISASGSATVNLTSSQTLTYVPGSVKWMPGGVNTQTLSNADNIASIGVNVGSVSAYQYNNNYNDLGYITFRAQISNSSNNNGSQQQVPTVATNSATNIGQNSATFSATVNPNGLSTSVQFQYGATQSLGSVTALQNISATTDNVNITESSITNLSFNTTYYYRITATNSIGTSYGSILSFTTSGQSSQQGQVPTVTTNSATNISQNSVTLNTSVNPNSSDTTVWFEYGASQSFGYTTASQSIGNSNASQTIAVSAFNLNQNSTYYYRAVANNSYGTSYGSTLNFVTSQSSSGSYVAPTISTNYATNNSSNYMTLNASVNPNGSNTTVWFEYGTSQSLGYVIGSQTIGSGNSTQSIASYISGLSSNTTYYYRIVAQNSYGTVYGSTLNSVTQSSGSSSSNGWVPTITTNYAINVSQNSATLSGTVNPNYSNTTAWFEYGTTNSLGYTVSSQSVGSGSYSQNITTSITGLQYNTTYYYRIVAQNSYGTVYGSILNFITTNSSTVYSGTTSVVGAPYVVTVPATFIYQNSVLLNGTSNPNGSSATAWFEWGLASSLGNTTNSSSMGQGSAGLLYSYALSGLQSSTNYYFRAVSQNSYGTTYGSITNFTTTGSLTYFSSIDQPTVYIQTPTTSDSKSSTSVVLLTPTVDNSNPASGDEVSYTLVYRNNSANPITNASLKIILPNEVSYEVSNTQPTSVVGNTLNFDLGNINSETQGIISIKSKIADSTKAGSALVFSSTINFTDSNNKQDSMDAYLTAIVKQGVAVTASLIDVLGSIFNSWFFDILLGLIIGFGGYHFFIKTKEGDLAG